MLLLSTCVAAPAWADDPCETENAELASAEKALDDCLAAGESGCDAEQARNENAARAAGRCEDEAVPAAVLPSRESAADEDPVPDGSEETVDPAEDPDREALAEQEDEAEPEPEPSRIRIGVLIEGVTGAERDAAEAAARETLAGATLVDAGAIRSARAFLGTDTLDDAAAAKLRSELGADRLLVVEVKAEAAARYLALRIIDEEDAVRRFAEATDATLAEEVKRLIADLPPPASAAAAPPEPAVKPAPVASNPVPAGRPPAVPAFEPWRPYVDVNLFAGSKSLAASHWAPLAAHSELGALVTVGGPNWPVHGASDFYYSFDGGKVGGANVRVTTMEACFGVRRIFDLPVVRPHAGGGLVFMTVANTASANGQTEFAGGSGTGFWLGGGAIVRVGTRANLGLQLRYSSVSAMINGRNVPAGGLHVGATLGFGFGSAAGRGKPYGVTSGTGL